MELRRWLKDLRVIAARRRGDAIVLEFHADDAGAGGDAAGDACAAASGRLRLTSGVGAARPADRRRDHDGVIAESRG